PRHQPARGQWTQGCRSSPRRADRAATRRVDGSRIVNRGSFSTRPTIPDSRVRRFPMRPLRSFLPVSPQSPFPIQNLPYGVCRRRGGQRFIAVAIGEHVLDLTALEAQGHLDVPALRGRRIFQTGTLNAFMAAGRAAWHEVRVQVSRLLRQEEATLRDDAE